MTIPPLTVHGPGEVRLDYREPLKPGFVITHRYPLAGWEQAVAALRGAGAGPRGKVLSKSGRKADP
jgi:hypothetical protein